jgi:hypothetical protein
MGNDLAPLLRASLVRAYEWFLDPSFSLLATSETIPTAPRHGGSEHAKLLTKIGNVSQLNYPHVEEVVRTKEGNPIVSKPCHEDKMEC